MKKEALPFRQCFFFRNSDCHGGPRIFVDLHIEGAVTLHLQSRARVVDADGVTEAFNPESEEFQEERLVESLNRHADAAPEDLVRAVHADVQKFADGAQQSDDITMLCLRYNGPTKS